MNDVTKYVNILHLTWESPTLMWPFKLLMRTGETKNSLNACYIYALQEREYNKWTKQQTEKVRDHFIEYIDGSRGNRYPG